MKDKKPENNKEDSRCLAAQRALSQIANIAVTITDLETQLDTTIYHIKAAMELPIIIIKAEEITHMIGMDVFQYPKLDEIIQADQIYFNHIIAIDDWNTHSDIFAALVPRMKEMGVRSSILCPILMKQTQIGYLWMASPEARTWTEEEKVFAQTVAQLIMLAVERLNRINQQTKLVNKIKRLSMVNRTLSQPLSFSEAISMIGSGMINLFDIRQTAILLREPDGQITCPWTYGAQKNKLLQSVKQGGQETEQVLFGSFKPKFIHGETLGHAAAWMRKIFPSIETNPGFCLPLVYENQVIGCISGTIAAQSYTTEAELEIMEAFSSTAAITLQGVRSRERTQEGYIDVTLALANAIDTRDSISSAHREQIAKWAKETAQMMGCSEKEVRDIYWAGLLHDIGKVSVPDNVLTKPGPLNDDEWEIIWEHPSRGQSLIKPLEQFKHVSQIIGHIREKYNGSGYPHHKKGTDIPLGSRILAVADAYSSMIIPRPYHAIRTEEEAIEELWRCSKDQFDPDVVSTFTEMLAKTR